MDESNAEAMFLSALNVIVEKHGCKIDEFDFQNNIINISGPEDKQALCAVDIAKNFEQFLV